MKRSLISTLSVILIAGICTADGFGQTARLTPDTQALVKGDNDFAWKLYGKLRQKDGNLFFSPYSISNAMAMAYAGAKGKTAEEIKSGMSFPVGQKRLHPAFRDLIKHLHSSRSHYELRVANRLWGQKDYGFSPDYRKLTETFYAAGMQEVDFIKNAEASRKIINAWVEERTQDKIKELIKKGVLTPDTRMVLTNAIYFKAAWRSPFKQDQTRDADFYLTAKRKVSVPMMNQSLRAPYFKGDTFHMVALPYEGNELSMLVIAPKKVGGLAGVEKNLTFANIAKWRKRMSTHRVTLSLPKFKVTSEFRLNDALKKLGIQRAFKFSTADFSGITTQERLYISAVLHKAFVDVNEAGTEAAASTAVVFETRSLPPRANFVANHPFVYVIQDNRTGSILFVGRLVNPNG